MLNVCDGESPLWSTGGGRGGRVESRRGVVVILSAVLVVCTSMMQVIRAGDIRDDTEARFYRARTAPEGGEGNHVVCV